MRQIAVIGLGNFGSTVAKNLSTRGAQVTAIDKHKDRVESIKESVSYAVALNSTDVEALKSINIQDFDVAVVCIGQEIEANLLTSLLLKKLGVKKIWARTISPLQSEILTALEVSEVVNLEEEMGEIVARSLISTSISKHIPLAPGHSIAEAKVPLEFLGKSIRQINPREKYNVNIVAIRKKKPQITDLGERVFEDYIESVPHPDSILEEDDLLLLVGTDDDIKQFVER